MIKWNDWEVHERRVDRKLILYPTINIFCSCTDNIIPRKVITIQFLKCNDGIGNRKGGVEGLFYGLTTSSSSAPTINLRRGG